MRARSPLYIERMLTMTNKIQRSRNDKMIAGVCGGLAQYFGVDPTIVRLVFGLLFFISHGAMLPIYIILWVIMPQEPTADVPRYDPYTGQPLS
jgi:phage shock protein C